MCAVLTLGGIAVPIVVLASGSHASTPPAPDTIVYFQAKNSSYIQYNVGGSPNNAGSFTQNLSGGGGGCSSPSVSNPVLAFNASYYPGGYNSPPQQASVGAYQGRTGVCAVPQDWSIENLEGLIFDVGPNAATAGRVFQRAQLVLQRQDKTSALLPVTLVLRLKDANGHEATVATVALNIPVGAGSQINADTGTTHGFDEIEIQDGLSTGSLSLVGPANTFTFENQLCAGSFINPTVAPGSDPALSLPAVGITAGGSGCKPYSSFTASGALGAPKTYDFAAQAGSAGETFTVHFDWGDVPYCMPPTTGANGAASASPAAPPCAPTTVDFGNGPMPETFCPGGANPPNTPPWCATDVQYYFVNVNGTPYTHIVEDWSGKGPDVRFGCC